jgi:hypothetical protein
MAEARQGSGLSWLVAALILLAAARAAVADAGLDSFVGRYHGAAHGESADGFFIVTLRDVTVDLRREGDGFRLAWSTLIGDAAEGTAPANSRHRDTVLHFIPGQAPGTFRTLEAAEPFSGRSGAWATLDGNRLTVRVLVIDGAGGWELQTYERTLEGDVMSLRFSRLGSGQPELVVTGRLTRAPE